MNVPESLTKALGELKEIDYTGNKLSSGDVLVYIGRTQLTTDCELPDLYMSVGKKQPVKALQAMLNNYGYRLTVDGIFGAATRNAVADFQTKYHVDVQYKGTVGRKTWLKIIKGE